MDYSKTVNLPQTKFAMKADLLRKEPEIQKRWDEQDLYGLMRKARAGAPKYVLHDGPPYPTGDLHIGTGLNKILKDFIVRYRTMRGCDAPYIPGWDCHGLPIEHQVMREAGEEAKRLDKAEIRKRCKKYAEKFVKLQKHQFKALGVSGDWERPYLTLQPEYEAGVLEVFGKLVEGGYVYRALKSIHWCMKCETALAEAELEYADEKSPSIYVNFKMLDSVRDLFGPAVGDDVFMLIWTTTPWTLPANMAIALHKDAEYAAVRYANPKTGRTEVAILADRLADPVMQLLGVRGHERIGKATGKQLEGRKYQHFYLKRVCPVVLADYVSLTDGTGCVHTAPGHGQEDYQTGVDYGIEIVSPVDARGVFTAEAGELAGMHINDGNGAIMAKLESLGQLLRRDEFSHSYPHCWRCKQPVIFRATKQWFISMSQNSLRQRALDEIKRVKWIPSWGETRISNMVAERPDWCISRQRSWGVPIPAFYCQKCDEVLLTKETVRVVRDAFARHGADSWFYRPLTDFLPNGLKCPKCGSAEFRKESDIFDVWFESGSSHHSVLTKRSELTFPCDMYLEGSDQHRGWFQLSLLPSLGAHGCAPFRTVLTHGFVVDEKGEKMSKSLGNFISVGDALKQFGGDVIRLWTSSLDYRSDMNVSRELINRMSDAYRRIRNTFRYLLGNLADFNPATDSVPYADMLEIDRWALHETQNVVAAVTDAFETLELHRVYVALHNFCAVEMSAFYLDILKDRLYTFGKTSRERRAAQTALHHVLLTLVKLSAPVIVHTADEAWGFIEHKDEDVPSVHLARWPEPKKEWMDEALAERWDTLIRVRSEVARELEKLRAAKAIGSSLEATVTLYVTDDKLLSLLTRYASDLQMIFISSDVTLAKGESSEAVKAVEMPGLAVLTKPAPHKKCARCWNYRANVGADAEHPGLCSRCVGVIRQANT